MGHAKHVEQRVSFLAEQADSMNSLLVHLVQLAHTRSWVVVHACTS